MRLSFESVIFQFRDRSGGYGPQIDTCHASAGRVAAPVFFEQCAVYLPMAVQHPQSPPDRQIAVAQNVGPLQGVKHQHFGAPYADAFQCRKPGANLFVGQVAQRVDIEFTVDDLPGGRADVTDFAERQSEVSQRFGRQRVDDGRGDRTDGSLYPLPDRFVCPGRNLLSDDGMTSAAKRSGMTRRFTIPTRSITSASRSSCLLRWESSVSP